MVDQGGNEDFSARQAGITQTIEEILAVGDINEREARTAVFIQERLKFLTEVSVPKSINLMAGVARGFIHPQSIIRPIIFLSGFQINDPEIYSLMFKTLERFKTDPARSQKALKDIVPLAVMTTVDGYFDNFTEERDVEELHQDFYLHKTDLSLEPFSISELKGQGIAQCLEKATTAQNIMAFLGYGSYLICAPNCLLDADSKPESHAYNVVTGEKDPYIYDLAYPAVVTDEQGSAVSYEPAIYPISKEQFDGLLQGNSVKVAHLSRTGTESTRVYNGVLLLDKPKDIS